MMYLEVPVSRVFFTLPNTTAHNFLEKCTLYSMVRQQSLMYHR